MLIAGWDDTEQVVRRQRGNCSGTALQLTSNLACSLGRDSEVLATFPLLHVLAGEARTLLEVVSPRPPSPSKRRQTPQTAKCLCGKWECRRTS